jgi:cysteine sulfinate desulfinase/cysteine desulfurase-like protein
MGLAADETDRVVRFSSGWETTADDWQALAKGVAEVAPDFSRGPQPSALD